jgi:transcriptional regulator with XRE-family HTH domain
VSLKAQRPLPPSYPKELKTIGDHLRKRRLDLKLHQKDVAKAIGVSKATVLNWEHGVEPEVAHVPQIIQFLGYVPFDCPEDPIGRLAYFKKVKGLSYSRLGKLMGRGPEQLTHWMTGRNMPGSKSLKMIEQFLKAT